jgi:hypothetical protein
MQQGKGRIFFSMIKARSNQPHSSDLQLSMLDNLEANRLLGWLKEHAQWIIAATAGLFGLLVILYFLTAQTSAQHERDYYQSYQLAQQFLEKPNDSTFTPLEQLLQRHPELHGKFDGLIAQTFLSAGNGTKAMPFATATLERTAADHEAPFRAYAQTTMLIAEGSMAEALKRSLALEQQLAGSKELPLLRGYNLVRLAILQQKIGDHSAELSAWQTWQGFAAQHSAAAAEIHKLYSQGKMTLSDYINNRQMIKV